MKYNHEKKAKELFKFHLSLQKKEDFIDSFLKHCVVRFDEFDNAFYVSSNLKAQEKYIKIELEQRIDNDRQAKKFLKK